MRNSVGSGELTSPTPYATTMKHVSFYLCVFVVDCYVSDEVIASRAGVRVRVVNTDAEGRMVMADLLCRAKESVRPCRAVVTRGSHLTVPLYRCLGPQAQELQILPPYLHHCDTHRTCHQDVWSQLHC